MGNGNGVEMGKKGGDSTLHSRVFSLGGGQRGGRSVAVWITAELQADEIISVGECERGGDRARVAGRRHRCPHVNSAEGRRGRRVEAVAWLWGM